MTWARKRWISRLFAAVLGLSMLPALIVPTGWTSGGAQYGTYERWIRAQLRIPSDAAVEEAIARAVEADAASFDDFIQAFLEAYAQEAPDQPISLVFTDRDLSDDALRSFLQRRYAQVSDVGVPPRVYFTSAIQAISSGDTMKSFGAVDAIRTAARDHVASGLHSLFDRKVVVAFRTLSSARSLGP